MEAAVQSLLEQAGRIDVLVNNAGYTQVGAIEESSIAEVQAQLDTNLLGVIRMIKAVLPVMRQQGSGRILYPGATGGNTGPQHERRERHGAGRGCTGHPACRHHQATFALPGWAGREVAHAAQATAPRATL